MNTVESEDVILENKKRLKRERNKRYRDAHREDNKEYLSQWKKSGTKYTRFRLMLDVLLIRLVNYLSNHVLSVVKRK